MDGSLTNFEWSRPARGGRVEITPHPARRGLALTYMGRVEPYNPVDVEGSGDPPVLEALLGLRLKGARARGGAESDAEVFRAFAQTYGLLGLAGFGATGVELVRDWNEAVGRLQLAWEAWTGGVSKPLQPHERRVLESLIEANRRDLEIGGTPSLRELRSAGIAHAQSELREHLQQHLYLDVNLAKDQIRWTVKNESLLGVAWFRLAEATGGDLQLKRCPGRLYLQQEQRCRGWVTVTSRSSTDTYCSPACKQKAYRRRVEARRLRQDGLGVKAVARRLRAPGHVVREWLQD